MAGIYLHIPFCRKKCHYCDFCKTTHLDLIPDFLNCLLKEITLKKDYLQDEIIDTVYFGGGTPSVLNSAQIGHILEVILKNFSVAKSPEITFEANPDDITAEMLSGLKKTGINRLSIGVQSFNDRHLELMNRRHTGIQAVRAIENAHAAGFDNISADLIMGIPGMNPYQFGEDLKTVVKLPVYHVSVYFLTYHQGTRFYRLLQKGLICETDEEDGIAMFDFLIDFMQECGYVQYEISNFARDNCYSGHNLSYWTGKSYLGLGPSAHSFDRNSRQWNISDTKTYINRINEKGSFFRREKLNLSQKYNEYVMTRLRTMWGIDPEFIRSEFGVNYAAAFHSAAGKYIGLNLLRTSGSNICLTREGILVSDRIIAGLFVE